MVIVKIKCGLGNQMYQYALGRRLSHDSPAELKVDLSWFTNIKKGDIPRELEIDRFNVSLVEATNYEIRSAFPGLIERCIERIRGRLNRNHFYRFYPSILKTRPRKYLDGYFQSYKYFEPIRDILLNEFTLKNGYSDLVREAIAQIQQADQSVAVHIRRGDYATVRLGYNGLCNTQYYEKGLEIIAQKFPNIKVFVFSDDIEWAKDNLKFKYETVFVSRPGFHSAEELYLMSLCRHQIIANSTFSWWSAWLNKNPEKIVVAPSRWLMAADISTSDLLPENWIKI